MKQDRYIFPAILEYAEDGISIEFPDLPGCLPCGQSTEEALKNAREAMALHLYGMEEDGEDIPVPSDLKNVHVVHGQVVVLVEAWMPLLREAMENKAVKKTLTIPKWLNDAAEKENINFSHLLQSALKQQLGIDEHQRKVE